MNNRTLHGSTAVLVWTLAISAAPTMAQVTGRDIRPPTVPARFGGDVDGIHDSYAEVCKSLYARAGLTLANVKVRSDHIADCQFQNGWGNLESWGSAFQGNQCPSGYGMRAWLEQQVTQSNGVFYPPHLYLYYGPGEYCQADVPIIDLNHAGRTPNNCSKNPGVADPIYPLVGTKRQVIDSDMFIGGINFKLTYDTSDAAPRAPGGYLPINTKPYGVPTLWSTNLHRLVVTGSYAESAQVVRGDGRVVSFVGDRHGNYTTDADVSDRLTTFTSNGYSFLRYVDAETRAVESYMDYSYSQYKPTNIVWANGQKIDLIYTLSNGGNNPGNTVAPGGGYLAAATDGFGRSIKFTYELPTGITDPSAARLKTITHSSGAQITVGYDGAGNLNAMTREDGKSKAFLYERPDVPWAMTGIVDESAVRFATFAYDNNGRATTAELAGGVDRFSIAYSQAPVIVMIEWYDSIVNVIYRSHDWQAPAGMVLTDPLNGTSPWTASPVYGNPYLTSRSQPAGSGCAASTSAQTYDANGNMASADDFNQHRTCYAHDPTRNLEVTRVEGLSNAAVCTDHLPASSALPTGSRKTSTAWHPDWRLPVKVAEPGKLTTYVYNGQGASCASGAPLLPDGKVIAVLCSKTEQSTTDVNGSQGLTPTLESGVPSRVWSYTYNPDGQVRTVNGPRTDVTDTTTYEYWPATDFSTDPNKGHSKGDLQKVTNALGKVTQYTEYDKAGRVLTMTDANQVTTTMTYWPRGWLKTSSVGGQTTQYDYWPTGLLKRVTQPDNVSYVDYSYDDAHRLRYVTDHLGNRIDYTLDNAGNRKEEKVSDPNGALSRQLTRIIDALGRVEQTTGRE